MSDTSTDRGELEYIGKKLLAKSYEFQRQQDKSEELARKIKLGKERIRDLRARIETMPFGKVWEYGNRIGQVATHIEFIADSIKLVVGKEILEIEKLLNSDQKLEAIKKLNRKLEKLNNDYPHNDVGLKHIPTLMFTSTGIVKGHDAKYD